MQQKDDIYIYYPKEMKNEDYRFKKFGRGTEETIQIK